MADYQMHKKEREIRNPEIIKQMLRRGKYTTMALCRSNEPYIVSMDYGYDEKRNALYFHTALKGLKLDILKRNPAVCGTVVENRGYKMNRCSHAYRSVVFQGKMSVVEEMEEKKHGMEVLLHHLEENPVLVRERLLKGDKVYGTFAILRLDITEITGKGSE